MALHTVHLAPFNPRKCSTTFSGQMTPTNTLARHTIKSWRDAIRAKFTANAVLNDVTGYTVSDIFVWSAAGNIEGQGFIVRDNVNDTEFTVVTCEDTDSAGAPNLNIALGGNGTNLRQHVKIMGETSHSTGTTYGWALFFNKDITTATVAADIVFTSAVALTFSGGDFTASAIDFNTSTNLAKMRPAHCEYGIQTNYDIQYFVLSSMTFDDVRGSVLQLVNDDTQAGGRAWFALHGLSCDPNDGADTDTSIVVQGEILVTGGEKKLTASSCEAYAFDVGGTLRVYDLDLTPASFGLHDALIDEGGTDKADWKVLSIYNGEGGSGTKGTVMEESIVQIGPEYSHDDLRAYKLFTDAETVVKYTARFAFMHETNTLLFPAPVNINIKTLTDV